MKQHWADTICIVLVRRLVLPAFSAGSYCVTLRYNMFGFHVGSLQVALNYAGVEERILWLMHGEQGREWQLGILDVDIELHEVVSHHNMFI